MSLPEPLHRNAIGGTLSGENHWNVAIRPIPTQREHLVSPNKGPYITNKGTPGLMTHNKGYTCINKSSLITTHGSTLVPAFSEVLDFILFNLLYLIYFILFYKLYLFLSYFIMLIYFFHFKKNSLISGNFIYFILFPLILFLSLFILTNFILF